MNIVKEHILFPTLVLQVKEILSKNECDEILQLIKNGQFSLHTHNALKGENTLSSYKIIIILFMILKIYIKKF